MSPLFNAVGAGGNSGCKPLWLQRYCFFLTYANKIAEFITILRFYLALAIGISIGYLG